MTLALNDRVKETTTVTGTGTATLLGATTGFQSFAVIGNANTTYYCIADQGGANWEVGIGTYTASGTTLARTTVLASSNAGSLVVFTTGVKDVFVTYPSEKGLWKDVTGNAIGLGTPAAFVGTNITGTASGLTAGNVTTNANLTGAVTSSGNATSLGSFTSLQLATALTDETGTGAAVFATSPTIDSPTYTGTLTGSTGILNIGSGQVYKDASGNMGIGTSSPGAKLDVNGNTRVISGSYLALFESSNNNQWQFKNNTNNLTFTYNSTEAMRIDSSGNMGIGTSSPSTKLTVAGAITITGAFALRGSYGAGAIVSNFAAGDNALQYNTTGSNNTASGYQALQNNTTGNYNTASGLSALQNNTTGNYNTASGLQALQYNTTGAQNTASGGGALLSNTTGNYNTASGQNALQNNTTGIQNTASGVNALLYNTTGIQNTASGVSALQYNTTGSNNTASGMSALISNTTGTNNTASGVNALYYNTTGNYNTASGMNALLYNTTGSGNSAFNPLNSAGTFAPVFNPTVENNRFCMGSTGVTNAYIQVAWTVVSDARDKTNFAPVPHGLDFVNQLQPTAYQFKEDRETDVATGIVRYGFKAQDILALEGDNPVIIDTEDLDKLRFNSDSLIPVLVNAIQELTARLQILEAK